MTRSWLLAAALVAPGLLGLPSSATAEDGSTAATTATCADCHTEVVEKFEQRNPHRHAVPGAASVRAACEACHGDGTAHMESGDTSLIKVPRSVSGAPTCLSCHTASKESHEAFGTSFHLRAGTACADCHSVHSGDPRSPSLLKKDPVSLCGSCHVGQRASFQKPFAHRLDRGGMTCVSCHEPHAGSPTKGLRLDRAGESPCLSCHQEMRGPFVFEHSAGDCTTCHEPHGSSNPRRLRRGTVAQLCLECHTSNVAGTLGSQPPSFHNLTNPRYRNCTTCHVAVHGSNASPALLK